MSGGPCVCVPTMVIMHAMTRPRGRPSKLTQQRETEILNAVRLGLSLEQAAAYAGVARGTIYRWTTDPRPEYRAFRERVDRAEAEAEVLVTSSLFAQSRTSPTAALGWLQARHPNRWPRRTPQHCPGCPSPTADHNFETN